MKLFTGDTVKKLETMLDKGENRKTKLQQKVTDLQEEVKALRNEEERDFQQSIMEDKEPSKKIIKDRKKAQEDLKEAQFQLEQIDYVIHAQLEKSAQDLEQERKDFYKKESAEFNKVFDDLHEIKMEYLNKLIEYGEKKKDYNSRYRRTFQDISNRVGLRRENPNDHFTLSLNRRYQQGGHYTPMVTPGELSSALHEGRIDGVTKENKDKFKQ